MKKKFFRVILAVSLLGVCFQYGKVDARADANSPKSIEFANDGISDPVPSDDNASNTNPWAGDYVYYGYYDDDGVPIKFRVLDASTTDFGGQTMFLDGDLLMFNMPFRSDSSQADSNSWQVSDVKTYLEDEILNTVFSSIEQNAIANSIKAEEADDYDSQHNISYHQPALTGEKLFLLSSKEAANSAYGYRNAYGINYARGKYASNGKSYIWWLRSGVAGKADKVGGIAAKTGWIGESYVTEFGTCIAPALNIKISDIAFSSPALGIKPTVLTKPSNYTDGEWKLTLKDGKDFSEGASIKNNKNTVKKGESIQITHQPLNQLSNTYTNVTAVITDISTNEILYYGSVNEDVEATNTIIELPNDLSIGTYRLMLFAEEQNGEYLTDYASSIPFTADITISEEIESSITYMDGSQTFIYFKENYQPPRTYVEGSNVPLPTNMDVDKVGFTFEGWYENSDFEGIPVTQIGEEETGNKTYYAKWKKDKDDPTYEWITGENGEWYYEGTEGLLFQIDCEFSKFKMVEVDGKILDPKYYIAKSGSTIVILQPEYLDTLSLGNHSIAFIFDQRAVSTIFEIKKGQVETPIIPPQDTENGEEDLKPGNIENKIPKEEAETVDTGDKNTMVFHLLLMNVSLLGIAFILRYKEKRSLMKNK